MLYALISMMISQIVPSIQNIIDNYDIYVQNLTEWVNKFVNDENPLKTNVLSLLDTYSANIEQFLNDNILSKTSEIVKTLSLSLLSIFKVCWNFVIGFIISFYLMSNKEHFAVQGKKLLYSIFDKDSANVILNNFRFTHNTFIGFIGGKIVDSIIIGLICFIGTTILRTPYAALVSVIIGVTNIVPLFGPFLGAVPSAILVLIVDPLHPLNCLYFIIFVIVLQQIDGNIIGPKILGNSTGLSSFWVIFAITFFGGMWGIFGMIVGVPLFAVIYAAIRSIINGGLIKKSLPIDSEIYNDIECIDEAGIHALNSETRNDYIKSKRDVKLFNGSSGECIEVVSGMRYMSNSEEWKRRVSVKWDDKQSITTTIVSFQNNEMKTTPIDISIEPSENKGNEE